MALRNNLNAEKKSDLVNFSSAIDGQQYDCLGDTTRGDSYLRCYYYDSASTATADNESVLSATGMSGVGRFIKVQDSYTNIIGAPGSKRIETYSGSTNASGVYSVTFGTAFTNAPNIQVNIIGGTNKMSVVTTSITTTGFSVHVETRSDVLGLLPSYANTASQPVHVLITEQ